MWLDEASNYIASCLSRPASSGLRSRTSRSRRCTTSPCTSWSRLSSSEVALRGLSWLFCLLLLYFVLFAMNELHLVARFVFASGVIVSDFTHYLAQEMRPYALAALTTLVSSVLLVRLLESRGAGGGSGSTSSRRSRCGVDEQYVTGSREGYT